MQSKIMMRFVVAVLAGLILSHQYGAAPAWAEDVEESKPVTKVEALHEGLIEIMKGGSDMGLSGRLETISPIVEDSFDVTALGASSIGLSTWRNWEKDQKQAYIDAFRRFLTVNYAAQFKSYSGQSFETVEVLDGPKRTKIVKTVLNRPNEDPVSLDYLVRKRVMRTRIVDVFLDGSISEAARRRSEFTSVYRDQGFDGLIASINQLADDLINEAEETVEAGAQAMDTETSEDDEDETLPELTTSESETDAEATELAEEANTSDDTDGEVGPEEM